MSFKHSTKGSTRHLKVVQRQPTWVEINPVKNLSKLEIEQEYPTMTDYKPRPKFLRPAPSLLNFVIAIVAGAILGIVLFFGASS
jgi:hypothetical protein